jgi:hypothetical protein
MIKASLRWRLAPGTNIIIAFVRLALDIKGQARDRDMEEVRLASGANCFLHGLMG